MNKEYIEKVRTFVRVSFWLSTSGILNLKEKQCVALYKELISMADWLVDKQTKMLVCNELGQLLTKLELYNEAMRYQLIHLALAIEANNKVSQIKAYQSLGYNYVLLHMPFDALSSYEKTRIISREVGDKKGESDACEMLGALHLALGNLVDAINFYKQQLSIAIETDNKIEQKSVYISMIKAYDKMEDIPHDEIIACYEEWLKVPLQDDDQEKGSVYGRLGNIHQHRNNYGQAITCYQKSLEIAKHHSNETLETMLCLNLGLVYFSQNDFQEASYYYTNALELAIKLDDTSLQGKAYDKLSRLCAEYTKDYAKAIEYCEKALQIAVDTNDIVGQLDCYEMLGCIHLKLSNINDAVEYFKLQHHIAMKMRNLVAQKMAFLNMADAYKTIKDFSNVAKCLEEWVKMSSLGEGEKKKTVYLNLGNAYQEMANTSEAIKCYENCLEIVQLTPDQNMETILNINLGYSYFSQSDFQKAIAYYGKGLELAIKLDDRTLIVKAYNKLGHLYGQSGDYGKAIEHFVKALEVVVDKEDEAKVCENIGDFYQLKHDYTAALKFHQRQLQICVDIESKCGQARACRKLGVSYERLGDYQEAIEQQEKDLQLRVEIGDTKGQAEAYCNWGTSQKLLGQFHDAYDLYKKGLETAKQVGDPATEQRAHRSFGDILFLLQNFKEADEYFEKSLQIALRMDEKEQTGLAYERLGLCKMKFSKYKEALELFNKQIRLSKEMGDRELEADGYFNKGTVCRILEDFKQAMVCFEEYLKIAEETSTKDKEIHRQSYLSLGQVYISIATLHQLEGEHEQKEQCIAKSINCSREALRWNERNFRQLRDQDHLKISHLDTFFENYNYLTLMLFASDQNKEALLASERGRARALSDLLVSKYNMDYDNQPETTPITYAEIENMAANVSIIFYFWQPPAMCTWVIVPGNPSTLMEGADEVAFSKLIKDNVYGTFRDKPAQCEDRSVATFDDQEHQKLSMPQKSTTIDMASEVLMLSASEMIKKRCVPEEDLDDVDKASTLEVLYKTLISPIYNELNNDEIVIIPDGLLLMVPFAALRDPVTGAFLSETKQIRLAPSLTSLKVLQESPADVHSKTGALIIGNPKVGKVISKGREIEITDLPYAEKEAEMIGNLLNVKPLIGSAATKEATKENLQKGVSIIHFAAHGSTNGKIYLAPSKTDDLPSEDDYILTMKDVQESGVRPQLVVLSCCHSGRGEIKAEGVIGMARAFLAAGARAVVASLWAIDDQATMVFMERFYSHLKQGERASRSLQQAMKDMRGMPRYSGPKFWAAFFLIGDNVTIKMQDK